ncbi:hypothetical protein PAMP_002016 [Pampus punctatissimus]
MLDILTFKSELTLIVNNLAMAVVSEILSVAHKVSLQKQNPETEEKLSALVNSLCVGAVDKILKMVKQESSGEDGGGHRALTEQTFILLHTSAAVDSKCLLVPLQSSADADGSPDLSGDSSSSSSPPPQAELLDHEYARLSPLPPAAAAGEGGASAARSGRKRKKDSKTMTEPPLRCSRCGMLFPNSKRLAEHQRKSHPECSVCRATFTGILKLREHEEKEHRLLPYTCDYCPKRFNHKAHRDLHVRSRHTGEKSCHCDICGKGYSCISVLKTHRITHFDKTFICDVCGKSFYHGCHLTRHKLVHQTERPYCCSACGKGFTQAENLRSHQAIHTGEKQLCSICGRSYRCLKNHVISKHSHELPATELPARHVISCDICGKKFPNPSQYRVHQRSHTGEKPFHCDLCGKSYRLKELLRDHRYTHTGEKPYSCSLCSKTFNLATSFLRHRSIHSGEMPFNCLACGKHFRLLTFLKAHLQTKAHLKQTQQRPAATSDLTPHGQKYVES